MHWHIIALGHLTVTLNLTLAYIDRMFCAGGVYVSSILHMEHVSVDVVHNPETVDVLNASRQQQQLRERQHQFSQLISPVTELTFTQSYVAVGQPAGVTVSSADDNFRIAGNGVWSSEMSLF